MPTSDPRQIITQLVLVGLDVGGGGLIRGWGVKIGQSGVGGLRLGNQGLGG